MAAIGAIPPDALSGVTVLGEINVTSPTEIRAIARLGGPDIAKKIWDTIEAKRGGK